MSLQQDAALSAQQTAWTNEPNLYYFPTIGTRVSVFADDTLSGYPEQYTEQYKAIRRNTAR